MGNAITWSTSSCGFGIFSIVWGLKNDRAKDPLHRIPPRPHIRRSVVEPKFRSCSQTPTMYYFQNSLPRTAQGEQGGGIIPLGLANIWILGPPWVCKDSLRESAWFFWSEAELMGNAGFVLQITILLLLGTCKAQLFQIKRSVCNTLALLILNDPPATAAGQSKMEEAEFHAQWPWVAFVLTRTYCWWGFKPSLLLN